MRWPTDRFYWAVLETPGRLRSGVVPPGLLAALEDELPIGIEKLHAVCTPAGEGRVLVCACPLEALTSINPSVLSLAPEALPPGLECEADISKLNLLIGDLESPARRSVRTRRAALIAATLLLCSGLAAVGLVRRTAHAYTLELAASDATDAVLAQVTSDHRDETLSARLGQLRQIADLARRAPAITDAAESLEGVLKNWPSGVHTPSKPQSLSITNDGVNIAVVIEGDPAGFLSALKAPPGFTLDEPRLTSVGDLTRLSLHMRPVKGGSR